jgi:hypothetical protein
VATRARSSPDIARYARAYLSRVRFALDDRLDDVDLVALDLLLSADHPHSLLRRANLTARTSRTAWAVRRT